MFQSALSVFLGFVLMMILVMTYLSILSMLTPGVFPTSEQIESGDIQQSKTFGVGDAHLLDAE